MNDKQIEIWDSLVILKPKEILQLFSCYHGTQILDDGFYEFLQDEGYIEKEY
mgnify:CR=1 FL=1